MDRKEVERGRCMGDSDENLHFVMKDVEFGKTVLNNS